LKALPPGDTKVLGMRRFGFVFLVLGGLLAGGKERKKKKNQEKKKKKKDTTATYDVLHKAKQQEKV